MKKLGKARPLPDIDDKYDARIGQLCRD